jgi:two-component system NarL family sensor kinase
MRSDLTTHQSDRRVGVRREILLLFGVGALVLIIIALGALAASRSVARIQALEDSERMTKRLSDLVVAPLLGNALQRSDPGRFQELSMTVENRMRDGHLTEVTVWGSDGVIVFSDDPEAIGRRYELPKEVTTAIVEGKTTSDFENNPEVTTSTTAGQNERYVEVYVPLTMPGQPTMAFEAYYSYEQVENLSKALFKELTPLALIPLIVLQIVQLPIAASLARRVRRHETERAKLLERTLSVSEQERMRIAADLHDGPIQDLAGVSYAVGAIGPGVPEHHQALLSTVQASLSEAIQSLRVLMVDLYPPDLSSSQLPDVVEGLAGPLRDQGVEVVTDVESIPEMGLEVSTTLYRVAREALANVGKHSQASQVTIDLRAHAGDSGPATSSVCLRIADNGIGLDPSRLDRRAEGHMGLRLLRDRIVNLGGNMRIEPGPGGGTVVQATLPLD